MKNYNLVAWLILAMVSVSCITSCQEEEILSLTPENSDEEIAVYKNMAHESWIPTISNTIEFYGKNYTEWTKEWWKYVMSFDCAHNQLNFPNLSTTPNQTGPIIFLVGTKSGFATRNIVMSDKQALLLPVMNMIKLHPCAESSSGPAPCQSVEQFLKTSTDEFIYQVTNMKVLLDGESIKITNNNRIATDLFYIKGNSDLVNCTDSCVTGQMQAAVSDGYWLFLPKLNKGEHTLRIHAEILQTGIVVDGIYYITVLSSL